MKGKYDLKQNIQRENSSFKRCDHTMKIQFVIIIFLFCFFVSCVTQKNSSDPLALESASQDKYKINFEDKIQNIIEKMKSKNGIIAIKYQTTYEDDSPGKCKVLLAMNVYVDMDKFGSISKDKIDAFMKDVFKEELKEKNYWKDEKTKVILVTLKYNFFSILINQEQQGKNGTNFVKSRR